MLFCLIGMRAVRFWYNSIVKFRSQFSIDNYRHLSINFGKYRYLSIDFSIDKYRKSRYLSINDDPIAKKNIVKYRHEKTRIAKYRHEISINLSSFYR
jgi:hypothetical protein